MRKPSEMTFWIVFAAVGDGFAMRELFRLFQDTQMSLLLVAIAGLTGVVLPLAALRFAPNRATRIVAGLALPILTCVWLNWESGVNRHALFASELLLLVAVSGFINFSRPDQGEVKS